MSDEREPVPAEKWKKDLLISAAAFLGLAVEDVLSHPEILWQRILSASLQNERSAASSLLMILLQDDSTISEKAIDIAKSGFSVEARQAAIKIMGVRVRVKHCRVYRSIDQEVVKTLTGFADDPALEKSLQSAAKDALDRIIVMIEREKRGCVNFATAMRNDGRSRENVYNYLAVSRGLSSELVEEVMTEVWLAT